MNEGYGYKPPSSSGGGAGLPLTIAAGSTYTVAINVQRGADLDIVVDGELIIDGELVMR